MLSGETPSAGQSYGLNSPVHWALKNWSALRAEIQSWGIKTDWTPVYTALYLGVRTPVVGLKPSLYLRRIGQYNPGNMNPAPWTHFHACVHPYCAALAHPIQLVQRVLVSSPAYAMLSIHVWVVRVPQVGRDAYLWEQNESWCLLSQDHPGAVK